MTKQNKKSNKKTKGAGKVYAVAIGRSVGIFTNWFMCKESVDGYSWSTYKSFESMDLANRYLAEYGIINPNVHRLNHALINPAIKDKL